MGRLSVNLRWRDLPIRDAVAARTGVPTVVGHDVRAGLLAEARLGAARGVRNAVFIAIGTGIAGARSLDGAIVPRRVGRRAGARRGRPGGPALRLWPAGLPGNHLLSGLSGAQVRRRGGTPLSAEEIAMRVAAGEAAAAAGVARSPRSLPLSSRLSP